MWQTPCSQKTEGVFFLQREQNIEASIVDGGTTSAAHVARGSGCVATGVGQERRGCGGGLGGANGWDALRLDLDCSRQRRHVANTLLPKDRGSVFFAARAKHRSIHCRRRYHFGSPCSTGLRMCCDWSWAREERLWRWPGTIRLDLHR